MARTRILGLIVLLTLMLTALVAPARAQVSDLYPSLQPNPVFPTWPALEPVVPLPPDQSPAPRRYLGLLSANPLDPDSIANPWSRFGSRFASGSVYNSFGVYGNRFGPESARNPFATAAPLIYGLAGTYLGKLSANPYDPDSISNPYGRYGNPYSPDSVNNPYGRFGSSHSPYSTTNPYTTLAPLIFGP